MTIALHLPRRMVSRVCLGLVTCGAALTLAASAASAADCAADNGGLILANGVCATIFADNLGQARHMAVGPDGTLYVNTWRSPYKKDAKIPPGGWLVALRDNDGDGRAEYVRRFGPDSASGVGGTGIAIYNNFLYAESNGNIERYAMSATPLPQGPASVVVSGLPMDGDHTMHSIAIAKDGALFVNSGSPSNACQLKNRVLHSTGKDPCDELATRAGLWKYDANRAQQQFSPSERYVTGLRNTVALALRANDLLYAVQHGRDQLHENWPERFTPEQGSELPAEILVRVDPGADYGWPYCYYDGLQNRYVLAPEYGGDGKRAERCTAATEPVAVFPAHWAPNGLLFYTGNGLPERYRNGAFIAFHGSWNRIKQDGYNVVFQPMDQSGKPSGKFEIFADGFAGPNKSPEGAAHRPTGLAMGLDGALYVSDDQGGRIYRIQARPEAAEGQRSR